MAKEDEFDDEEDEEDMVQVGDDWISIFDVTEEHKAKMTAEQLKKYEEAIAV